MPTRRPDFTVGTKRQTARHDLRSRPGPPPTLLALNPVTAPVLMQILNHKLNQRIRMYQRREMGDKQKIMTRLTPFGVHLEPQLSMQQQQSVSAWLRGERASLTEGERDRHAQLGPTVWIDGPLITTTNAHYKPSIKNTEAPSGLTGKIKVTLSKYFHILLYKRNDNCHLQKSFFKSLFLSCQPDPIFSFVT